MKSGQKKPNITLSKSGLFQVSPSEILRSEVGRTAIQKTAKLAATCPPKQQPGQVNGKK